MPNQLTGFVARCGKAEPVNHAVKTPLEQHQQIFAGDAFHLVGFLEIGTELLFQQTIGTLDTLLLAQLGAVIRNLDAPLTMLSGSVVAPFDRTLVSVTPVTFEKQLHIFPPAHAADGTCISSQRSSSL